MPYLLLVLLYGATIIAYVQRSAISVPATLIGSEFAVDGTAIGLVMSSWYWGYAAFQIPAGWMADRWGSRLVLAVSALAWSLLTILAGVAGRFSMLLIVWTLMGAAQAGLFPCATKIIGLCVAERRRALVSGLLACSMALGAALAPRLTGYLLTSLRWQEVFVIYGVPGLLWSALLWRWVREPAPPAGSPGLPPLSRVEWRQLFLSRPMFLLCAQQFLRAAAMVFFSTWFPRFLQESYGVTQLEAGRLTTWPCVAVMVGFLTGGITADWIFLHTGSRWWSRQGVAVIGMTLGCLLCLAASLAGDTQWVVGLISAGAFWASFGGVSGYPAAIEYGGSRVATVFSTMNMCGNIGASVFPITTAWLVQTYHSWHLALLLFAGVFAADAVCWALFRPPRRLPENHSPLLEELAV